MSCSNSNGTILTLVWIITNEDFFLPRMKEIARLENDDIFLLVTRIKVWRVLILFKICAFSSFCLKCVIFREWKIFPCKELVISFYIIRIQRKYQNTFFFFIKPFNWYSAYMLLYFINGSLPWQVIHNVKIK